MAVIVQAIRTLRAGENDTLGVDCRLALQSAETIAGSPTVASSPAGLTVSSPQSNVAPVEIDGAQVAAGKALLCGVSGGVAGNTYEVIFTFGTTIAPVLKTLGIKINVVA